MRAIHMIAGTMFVTLMLCGAASALHTGEGNTPRTADEALGLIVKFKSDVDLTPADGSRSRRTTGLAAFDKANAMHNVQNVERLLRATNSEIATHPFRNIFVVSAAGESDLQALKSAYEELPEVAYVGYNYPIHPHTVPNDSLYSYQWYLNNTGQLHPHVARYSGSYNDSLVFVAGLAGSDIKADTVFQDPPDNTMSVVVAIIDSGVDTEHPELAGHIWTNENESLSENGIDDDNNGYIDDLHGWDFSAIDDSQELEDNDPSDYMGHGTLCAGLVASSANNQIGAAGICPNALIMPIKVYPIGTTAKLINAVLYAVDNGADVVSMSLGQECSDSVLAEALQYGKNKGCIFCASMGNEGIDSTMYPAGYSTVIAVGASNDSDYVTEFSSTGEHIDVVAPGLAVVSLRAEGTDIYYTETLGDKIEPFVHIIDSIYYIADGTSMSCPIVAGVAAYMRSISPGLLPDIVEQIIEQTALDLADPYGNGGSYQGFDNYSGYGRVDLNAALNQLPEIRAKIDFPKPNEIYSGYVAISGIADGSDFTSYTLEYGEGADPTSWTEIRTSYTPVSDSGLLGSWISYPRQGKYTIRLRVGDDNADMVTISLAYDNVADISYPETADTAIGLIKITGDAYCNLFTHYILDCRPASDTTQPWTLIDFVSVPKFDEILTAWNTFDLTPGDYQIRLRVFSVGQATPVAVDTAQFFASPFDPRIAWITNLDTTATIIPNYGDFNNDGNNEIVVGTKTGIEILDPADGSSLLAQFPTFPSGDYTMPVSVGNLDGDGIDDFVALNVTEKRLYCLSSTNGLYFIYMNTTRDDYGEYDTEESELPYILLSDIDNDNIDEIFVHTPSVIIPLRVTDNRELINWPSCRQIVAPDIDNDSLNEIYVYDATTTSIQERTFSGTVLASSPITMGTDSSFMISSMFVYDIDADGIVEIMVYGCYDTYGYCMYAFEDDLTQVSGWPRTFPFASFWLPTTPVLGDIDNDGMLELALTSWDFARSHVYVWNIEDYPYTLVNALDIPSPEPAQVNYLTLVDMDDDETPDIVAGAQKGIFGNVSDSTVGVEYLWAWDHSGQLIDEASIQFNDASRSISRFTPTLGDIDGDGKLDLAITTALNELIFMNYGDLYDFNACASPVTSYRYHRNFDNLGPSFGDDCYSYICGDANNDDVVDTLDCQYILAYLYYGGPAPIPYDAGDVNCNPGITLSDYSYLANYLYYGGSAPCDCGQAKPNDILPVEFSLRQNYPNPFNPTTAIAFSLPAACQVTLEIYNITGRKVATVVDDLLDPGEHVAMWDSRNDSGKPVASGVYFYRIKAGDRIATRKMVLLK